MPAIYLPNILLTVPRNVVTALGLPLALGMLSGLPTAKVVRGPWYNVRVQFNRIRILLLKSQAEPILSSWSSSKTGIPCGLAFALPL